MQQKLNASDLSAKLLANENISVRRARARTASFDIKSRVLTLPMWKDMTPEIEGMLNGHEVGHALFTTEEYMEPLADNRNLQGYLNVLEDIRVEKLMKRRYPGIRKTMNEGYKQLNDRDFFGVKQTDVDALNLIDRINLYYKVGLSAGVKFSIQEKLFVARAENTERVEEVVALAKEIYDYSKTNAEERMREALQNGDSLVEDDEDIFDADDLDEIDEDFDVFNDSETEDSDADVEEDDKAKETKKMRGRGEKKEEKTEEQVEKELESKTDAAFSQKLEELADDKTQYNYYTIDEDFVHNPIVGYKTILEETKESEETHTEKNRQEYDAFKLDSTRVVNYLIKEFEMKKSATMFKRAQQAKSGSLDMGKVWAYKLNDDLFKRVTTFPKGKNHGMVFLLDWSGSMDYYLEDTLKQVINLAMFCQRAQIPYHVFAFTTQYDRDELSERQVQANYRQKYMNKVENDKLSNAGTNFMLLEFFNNKMSTSEFNTMVRRVLAYNSIRQSKNGSYSTGGTPLNESLSYMLKFIPEFVKKNSIEKMSFITLTDGEGGQLYPSQGNLRSTGYDSEYKSIKHKHFISDPVTKKTYEISQNGSTHTEAILRMIKDRYGVNSVGFFICSNSRRVLHQAITANLPAFNGDTYNMIEKMRREFRDNGFASLKNSGRDDLFIVPINKLAIEQDEMKVKEDQSAKQIARNFSKVMGGRRTSRVLLNKFIDYVA